MGPQQKMLQRPEVSYHVSPGEAPHVPSGRGSMLTPVAARPSRLAFADAAAVSPSIRHHATTHAQKAAMGPQRSGVPPHGNALQPQQAG